MNFLHAVILGVVEGITEFLPISSTGHLVLTSHLLGISADEFVKSFEIAIQLGAIGAVVYLYGDRLVFNKKILSRVVTAFLPTAVIGLAFYPLIKNVFLESMGTILFSLLIGGAALIVFEWWYGERGGSMEEISELPYRSAFLIGCFQSIALIPGVSRAASTIVGGLLLGMHRKTIVEFSFMLAVPTMLAATALDIVKNGAAFSGYEILLLLVGCVVSFAVAIVVIKFLIRFVQDHTFVWFGVYRIALALIGLLIFF